ncbi:ribosome maturation factor RimP [bacterium]|nr:ribosome maturation factor RimP [bacterium]
MSSLQERLIRLTESLLAAGGFELVEIAVKGHGRSLLIQFFIDRKGGLTIDHCAQASANIQAVLDGVDLGLEDYRLEVSSPGTDRPLKTRRDFERNLGRNVRVAYRGEKGMTEADGLVDAVRDDGLLIAGEKTVVIPWDAVAYAKIRLKW